MELAEGTVLLNDPPAVHDALRRTNTDFLVTSTIRRDAVSGLRGDPATDDWMRGRRAVQKGMSPAALREHREWLAGEADRLGSAWRERGTVQDPVRELEDLTSRSFARFCFGTREVGAVARRTGDLLNAITPIISSPYQLPRLVRRLLPRYRRSVTAQQALEEELRRALAAPGEGGLVESLVDAGLDTEATVRMLVASGLASYRVPAAALAWTLVALARHPEDADACADAPAEGGIVSWVVAESLRLWPPNWLILRTANGEQECDGWRVPAGSAVIISPYVVHRTAPTFLGDDPLAFRPRRWESLQPAPGEYLPYGIGSRWCVGRSLADLELTTILTRLVTGLRFTVWHLGDRPDVRTTLLPRDLVLGTGPR
ncbi:cytochrome P450 [Streptomyces mayteni]